MEPIQQGECIAEVRMSLDQALSEMYGDEKVEFNNIDFVQNYIYA